MPPSALFFQPPAHPLSRPVPGWKSYCTGLTRYSRLMNEWLAIILYIIPPASWCCKHLNLIVGLLPIINLIGRYNRQPGQYQHESPPNKSCLRVRGHQQALLYLLNGWIEIPQVIEPVGAVATRCYVAFVAMAKPTAILRVAPSNTPRVSRGRLPGHIPKRPSLRHRPW